MARLGAVPRVALASSFAVLLTDDLVQTVPAFMLGATVTTLAFGWMLGFDARSLRWAWGAWGEQWTADELEKLDPSWRVYHDLPDGRSHWVESPRFHGHVVVRSCW